MTVSSGHHLYRANFCAVRRHPLAQLASMAILRGKEIAMPHHAANIAKVEGFKLLLRKRMLRGYFSSKTQREDAKLLSFLTKARPHLIAYNNDLEKSNVAMKSAARKIFTSARTAVNLSKRKTFRKGEFNAQLGRVNEGIDLLYRNRSAGILLLIFCGITRELVRWATGQSPPTCLLCLERERDCCEGCTSWPGGSPFDPDFNPEEHWILATPMRSELNPCTYSQMEQQLGLLRLFEARLKPSAAMLSKPERRQPNLRVQDLMFELFEIYEVVYAIGVYHKSEKAMSFFQWFLPSVGLTIIKPNYWMRRFENKKKCDRADFDEALEKFKESNPAAFRGLR